MRTRTTNRKPSQKILDDRRIASAQNKLARTIERYEEAKLAVKDAEAHLNAIEAAISNERADRKAAAAKRKAEGKRTTINGVIVERIYRGKAATCCCGCAGTFSESPAAIDRAIRELEAFIANGVKVDDEDSYMSVEYTTDAGSERMLTAYYKEGIDASNVAS